MSSPAGPSGSGSPTATAVRARHAVLADVPGPGALPRPRRRPGTCPPGFVDDVRRFEWDDATLKVNWALDAPDPVDGPRRAAGRHGAPRRRRRRPRRRRRRPRRGPDAAHPLPAPRPDDDRRPDPLPGGHRVGVGLHPPPAPARRRRGRGRRGRSSGWRRPWSASRPASSPRGAARQVQPPRDLQAADASLSRGALNAGTAALHQQLVLRPTRGLGRPETPVPGLYLAGASAHPGGGVHGACGWNAAVVGPAPPRPARRGAPGAGPHGLVTGAARARRS